MATLQIGTFVKAGDKLGAVVPAGGLTAVAEFLPSVALGRVHAGQPARLRLDSFPWTQYGSLATTVSNVASEVRDGRVRVELTVASEPTGAAAPPARLAGHGGGRGGAGHTGHPGAARCRATPGQTPGLAGVARQ